MQHVLLVSFVLGCVTAARIDTRDSVRRDQEDPEPVNLDRITCLREDNLDLVGAADAADRYFLRKVVGTSNEETHGDIYIFGEQLQIKSLEAKVSFHRADADSFEFELSGDRTTGKHGEYSGLGIAEVWISGFEVMTKNKLVNWATAMATNRDVLREGQDGTLYFSLSGKVRAKNVKGVWTAELVSKEVKYFKFNFNSQKVLDYALNQFGGLDQLVLDSLFGIIKSQVPMNLMASLTYLPLVPGRDNHEQDLWLEVNMDLGGSMAEPNGQLDLDVGLSIDLHANPGALFDVLATNFDVKAMARQVVVTFLRDPAVQEAWNDNREVFLENLKQYRFVMGKDLLMKVKHSQTLADLSPTLLAAAESQANDLFVKILEPFIKAHSSQSGGTAFLEGFKVSAQSGAGWGPETSQMLHARLLPVGRKTKEGIQALEGKASLLSVFGLGALLPQPPAMGTITTARLDGFHFDSRSMRIDDAIIENWNTAPANGSQRSYQVRTATLGEAIVSLPEALQQNFQMSGARSYITMTPASKITASYGKNGIQLRQLRRSSKQPDIHHIRAKSQYDLDGLVPDEYQRPTGPPPLGFLERVLTLNGTLSLDVEGTPLNGVRFSSRGRKRASLDVKPVLTGALAGRPKHDTGYVFWAGALERFTDSTAKTGSAVRVVLNCGFLRLFAWPLDPHNNLQRVEGGSGQWQIDVRDLEKYAPLVLTDKDAQPSWQCLMLTRLQSSGYMWRSSVTSEQLCGPKEEVDRLYGALQLQSTRFEDSRAAAWRYGTHDIHNAEFLLPRGRETTNLQQVLLQAPAGRSLAQMASKPAVASSGATHATGGSGGGSSSSSSSIGAGSRSAVFAQPAVLEGIQATAQAESRGQEATSVRQVGSLEGKRCRAQEALDKTYFPPDTHGDAAVRLALPGTPLGPIFVVVRQMQFVNLDFVGKLHRQSDSSFGFEIGGPDGSPATVQMYIDGIDFSAPESSLPGLAKAVSAVDSVLRPVYTLGMGSSDSLERGPLVVKFKMKGVFKLKSGHWSIQPNALSQVSMKFGKGGAVQSLVNHLIDSYGNMDQVFLKNVWPFMAGLIPESMGTAFTEVQEKDGKLTHEYRIKGKCQGRAGDKCGSNKVDIEIEDTTRVTMVAAPITRKYVEEHLQQSDDLNDSLVIHSLKSYLNCTDSGQGSVLNGVLGEAAVALDFSPDHRLQVNVSTQAAAPNGMMECLMGTKLFQGCVPELPERLHSDGSLRMEGTERLYLPQAFIKGLRLPLSLGGKEDALEFSATFRKVDVVVVGAEPGPVQTLYGNFDLVLDRANGLVLKRVKDGFPLLSVNIGEEYLLEPMRSFSKNWTHPPNVRKADPEMPDGIVPRRFQRPHSQMLEKLDIEKLVEAAQATAGVKVQGGLQETKETLEASVYLSISATLNFGNDFWRAVITRRVRDDGFLYVSASGLYGTMSGTTAPSTRAFLEMSCGNIHVYQLKQGIQPYSEVLLTVDLYEYYKNPEMRKPKIMSIKDGMSCWLANVESNLFHTSRNYFCGKDADIDLLQEALSLQFRRFSNVEQAIQPAKAADEQSLADTHRAGYGFAFLGTQTIFADTTWFRRFNPWDRASWLPDLLPPASVAEVQTPRERWLWALLTPAQA